MPELAEVEYYRKVWDRGRGDKVVSVELQAKKRIFRGCATKELGDKLQGAKLLESHAHGKQMLFQFSGDVWLGIHLGMSGLLLAEAADYLLQKHDHLVLRQKKRTLVFRDPRQFGRVRFDVAGSVPTWWAALPPPITSRKFTQARVRDFLLRHRRAPVKAVILLQEAFPGIGNWMADEVLWQARIRPSRPAGKLSELETTELWEILRRVTTGALKTVGKDYSDPPKTWLFRHRWKQKAFCPNCAAALERTTVGGRTTRWCATCQM